MAEDLQEELEVVQSIYCREGECVITDTLGSLELTVKLQKEGQLMPTVTVRMQFSSLYPRQPPTISCQCEDRSLSHELVTLLTELSSQLQGTPMVSELLTHAQEILNQQTPVEAEVKKSEKFGGQQTDTPTDKFRAGSVTAVLVLDHMRSRARYVQTIQKWVTSLSLQGCLVFIGKVIFIVIQGHSANVKEYIKLQRSSNVDVDSRGKKCKERMMSVVHQGITEGRGFKDFKVMECSCPRHVEDIFLQSELLPLYQEHIQPLLKSSNIS
ncbi:RWD domain-containing protein 3-like [Ostrea edulis]|uniref:RWD domain-containing protein 3-like n=1 Tax=Ostrea edulis TaxID=37623 RepID=UPI002095C928|nr:RWD domain-containing protein 3-like [Ostrea edulis]